MVFKIYINETDFCETSFLKSGTKRIKGRYSWESTGSPGNVVNDFKVLNIDKFDGYFIG
jgi:hypothetical protein